MRPISRLLMLTLTVVALSQVSVSFAAASWMAEAVGKRYSKELARIMLRS